MEGDPNLTRNPTTTSSSSSSSADFLRHVQAAFKRHRPIGTMPSTNLLPRRSVPVPPHKHTSSSSSNLEPEPPTRSQVASKPSESQDVATLSPPSFSATITNTSYHHHHHHPPPIAQGSKKVNFSSATSQGAHGHTTTRLDLDNLSSHMDSLALTEMEWEAINQADSSNFKTNGLKQHNPPRIDADGVFRPDAGSSGLAPNMSSLQNQLHHLRDFLHNDVNHPMTQSSMLGSSCATTTSVHATSAPRLNSTTHSSCPNQDCSTLRSSADANFKSQNIALGDGVHQVYPASMPTSGAATDRVTSGGLASSSAANASVEVKDIQLLQQCQAQTDRSQTQCESLKDKEQGTDASCIPPSCPSSKDQSSIAKLDPAKSDKQAKAPSRKKGYDPDLFFKVNGKLYQRLGKIGSGGSSEVHKVISSDCTIYALKKIKLKGRDYATAYGFCQEILYLKKLKGKDNIIQLIDFEVTDKALLHAVMNDLISNKDKVKDDGYIYMVLEYGEIDLAHMLSQKWKVIDASNSTMDENWLRFYWQQILQAVNTIHEERIVHSDLKPANFLLVKGSLKLIDFGIAKAIMSDTTNIQRDAQVGTLSYMSPEAFMCNESDANGNTIKCGRPSDIWSLGCILYQMVYGRTPFSEYKTFWAKFKVITDPNHEIIYGPVSNPWLMDLMKKCLAWDRNERWRIPQLLEHPFLVPPVRQLLPAQEQNFKFIQLITESYPNDEKVSNLCTKFQTILELGDPVSSSQSQQIRLLSQMSSICQQLQEHITKIS